MARVFTPALLDFSTGLVGALDEHAAIVSGSRPPALNLKERGQARQAFLGSIIGLNDGSVHLVGLKNGVVDTANGICLRLTPLAGGQARQVYPAELAQSVNWVAASCMSSHGFQQVEAGLEQGFAANGICLRDDPNTAARLVAVADNGESTLTVQTATAVYSGLTADQAIDKTSVTRVPWRSMPPALDAGELAARRARPVDPSGLLGMVRKSVWVQENMVGDESRQDAAERFDGLAFDDDSWAAADDTAEAHYTSTLAAFGVDRAEQFTLAFMAALLVGLARCPGRLDEATHCLGQHAGNVSSALALLMELVIVIGQASPSALRDATGAVPGDRDPAQGAALAVAALAKLTELGDRPMPAQEQAQRQEQLQRLQMAPGANQGAQARPPPPPPPPAQMQRAVAMLTPAGGPDPAAGDEDARRWIADFGGNEIQTLVADAAGRVLHTVLTPLGQPASVRRTAKDLVELVASLEQSRAWTRDARDPLWAADRPADWDAARERLGQLLDAVGDSRRGFEDAARRATLEAARVAARPAPPPPAAPAPPLPAVTRGFGRAPGEVKLEKATAQQKAASVVCTAQVLGPLQEETLLAAELLLGSATARAAPLDAELRRLVALPGPGTAHAAAAFVVSSGTRNDGDAQGAVPVNHHQARKDALAALEKSAWEAVGRRRITSDVRAKITKVVEALLAGNIDLELVTQLFGGIAPAKNRGTAGFEEGDGTWGKMSVKADIKQALLFAFSLVRTVHLPLLGLDPTPVLDFGLAALFTEAQYLSIDRLVSTLKEAFETFGYEFEAYRSELAAPAPCLRSALSSAIVTALVPLAAEQQTIRAAVHAAEKVCGAQKPSAASDKKIAALERTVADLSAKLTAVASRPLNRTDPGTPTRHAPAHPSHCPSSINLFTLFTSTSTQPPLDLAHGVGSALTPRPRDLATTRPRDLATT